MVWHPTQIGMRYLAAQPALDSTLGSAVSPNSETCATRDLNTVTELTPRGKDPLVQIHAHRVVLMHHTVENALHVAMGAKALANRTLATKLGVQLNLQAALGASVRPRRACS